MAGAVALVLAVQSFATYGTLSSVMGAASSPSRPSTPSTTLRSSQVLGVSVDSQRGLATVTMTPFTSESVASALGAKYGMNLVADFRSFGQYVFSLPQIRLGPGPAQHTATVYFPPYATASDVSAFLARNGLQTKTWLSTDDATGRTAVVALPQVKPVLIDPLNGVWRATVGIGIDRARLDAWAKTNRLHIISYNTRTGTLLIQGPRPKPVIVRTVIRRPIVSRTTTQTNPATNKLYIALVPGTTFSSAQTAIQHAGAQLTSYNSATELATATVPVAHVTQAAASLRASPVVHCVSGSSTACVSMVAPGTTTPSTTDGSTQTNTTTATTTTDTGTGWTTTDVPVPPATTTVPLVLTARPADGHVALSWTSVSGAQSYQVYRATGTEASSLVATTTATTLTDVGGVAGAAYSYSVVPVLSSGPDSSKAQAATATWLAATSRPEFVSYTPGSTTLSGTVALSVDVRTGDGAGNATWSLIAAGGATTQAGTAASSPLASDPLTWTARTVWNSRAVADGAYTLVVVVTDGAGHNTQIATQMRVSNSGPAAPTSLGASTIGETVVLTWHQPAAAKGAVYLVQKDAELKPVAASAYGSLSWTDEVAGHGTHTYTVVLEDQFGHQSAPVTTSAVVSSTVAPAVKPLVTLRLPNGDALAPDGAVDDRLIIGSNLRSSSGVSFQYSIDGGQWTDVQGTMSCSPSCSVDRVCPGAT